MESAVVALINHEGKILLGKKRKDPNKWFSEKWHIPGETIEAGESDEEALMRGIKEETGIEIKVEEYLIYHISPRGKVVRWYRCTPMTYDASAGSDLVEVRWVKREEVPNYCEEIRDFWPEEIKRYFGLIE